MKYRYRTDEELKDSGVEWLGKIPKEWEKVSLSNLGEFSSSSVDKKINADEKMINLINYLDVYKSKNKIIDNNIQFMQVSAKLNQIISSQVNKGDVLFTPSSETVEDIGHSAVVIENIENALFSYHLVRLKFIKDIDNNFKRFQMNSHFILNQFSSKATGTTRMTLSKNDFKTTLTVLPPHQEQQKIALFLDKKTAEFDSIIEKKQSLITKLTEAKKSLISEVVTGKVKVQVIDNKYQVISRADDEMKDSGVEWLGKIPKEWEQKKIKFLYEIRNERNKREMEDVEILSLYTALGVKRQDEIEYKTGNKVRTVEDYKIVHPNDIVVNIILAWMGAIGMSESNGVISPAYDIYKPLKNVYSKYYNYLFRTDKFAGECFRYGRGIMLMRWRTYSDEFKSIVSCQPTIEEQENISNFLDEKTAKIDSTIEKIKLQIEKLKGAKQSLISEAVTGKIEVMG